MSGKLKKWYVVAGIAVGGLAVCFLLLLAGGLAGGMAGYAAAQRGRVLGLSGPWREAPSQAPRSQEVPEESPQLPQPWQALPEAMLGPSSGQLRGALIVEVESGGPADQAGMETGDIVIAVNNKGMDADRDLTALISGYDPGDEVVVTIVRHGDDTELMELEVTLGTDTDEGGDEVVHLGVRYQSVSSGVGLMSLERGPRSGRGSQTD